MGKKDWAKENNKNWVSLESSLAFHVFASAQGMGIQENIVSGRRSPKSSGALSLKSFGALSLKSFGALWIATCIHRGLTVA